MDECIVEMLRVLAPDGEDRLTLAKRLLVNQINLLHDATGELSTDSHTEMGVPDTGPVWEALDLWLNELAEFE